jgi:hypothetical protein
LHLEEAQRLRLNFVSERGNLRLNFVSERGNMRFDERFEEPWSELLNGLLDRPSNSLAALVINGERNVENEWKNFAHLTCQRWCGRGRLRRCTRCGHRWRCGSHRCTRQDMRCGRRRHGRGRGSRSVCYSRMRRRALMRRSHRR